MSSDGVRISVGAWYSCRSAERAEFAHVVRNPPKVLRLLDLETQALVRVECVGAQVGDYRSNSSRGTQERAVIYECVVPAELADHEFWLLEEVS